MLAPLQNIPRPLWLTRKSTYADEVLSDSPIGYWRLNETSGSVAVDQTGAHNGTYGGATSLGAAGPIAGDTASHAISSTSAPAVAYGFATVPALFTVECWLNLTVSSQPYGHGLTCVASCCTTSTGVILSGSVDPYYTARQSMCEIWNASQPEAVDSGGGVLAAGVWHHLASTYDGSHLRMYVDGVLITAAAYSGWTAAGTGTHNWCSGGEVAYSPGTLNGYVAEAALYPTALSASRILAHYQKGVNLI